MCKKELLDELSSGYKKMSQDYGLKCSWEDLDSRFGLTDYILEKSFVAVDLSRQLRWKIVDLFVSWSNVLYELLFPNPQNFISITENKQINTKDKKEIQELIKIVMRIVRRHNVITLCSDKTLEAEFYEDSIKLWDDFSVRVHRILVDLRDKWHN